MVELAFAWVNPEERSGTSNTKPPGLGDRLSGCGAKNGQSVVEDLRRNKLQHLSVRTFLAAIW